MSDHRPTIINDPDQDGESLDADLLPEEFPDDRPLASRAYGTTEAEQARGESLSRKLRREVPELSSDGDTDADDDDGCDDIISSDDEDADPTNSMVSIRGRTDRHDDDSGQPRGPRSAELDAMHLVDRDPDLDVVAIAPVVPGDAEEFLDAVAVSEKLHLPWVAPPATRQSFLDWLARDPDRNLHYTVRVEEGLVGIINANEVVRGVFHSAYLGYYAFEGFAGRGLMQAGMRAVLSHLFDREGLHRVEANIRPENERSIRLVERLGFRREGYSPAYLYLDGAWRDHERWALLATDPR